MEAARAAEVFSGILRVEAAVIRFPLSQPFPRAVRGGVIHDKNVTDLRLPFKLFMHFCSSGSGCRSQPLPQYVHFSWLLYVNFRLINAMPFLIQCWFSVFSTGSSR